MRSEDAAGAPREARLWEIVFPDHADHLGTLFGGHAAPVAALTVSAV